MRHKENMKNKLLLLCTILHGILIICACDRLGEGQDEYSNASLTIRFCSLSNQSATRGIEDLDDDGNVSALEEISDGRRMYRLAVFLVNNELVAASTVLEENDLRFNDNRTVATVSFDNLDYGKTYNLYAVANYGEYEMNNGHLTDIIDITRDISISTSADNLCDKNTPYPLSLQKEIILQPGANQATGELIRTYARIRINVRNQSNKELKVTQLQFADKFSQNTADLFTPGGTANVTPNVISENAITPFSPDMTMASMDASNNVTEETIFDSYILESNGGNYYYTLGLEYKGDNTTEYKVSSTVINNPESIKSGAMYVIYNTNQQRYLYANGTSSVGAASSYNTDGILDHNFVWRFTETGNNYSIESMGSTGYYISSGLTNNSAPLTNNSSSFTISTSSNNLRLRGSRYYLGVNGSRVYGTNTGNRRNFVLYEVTSEQVTHSVEHQEKIEIKAIDKTTGEVNPIQEIKRNDFINILINVSYNEKSGELEFKVSDWEEITGEITFD